MKIFRIAIPIPFENSLFDQLDQENAHLGHFDKDGYIPNWGIQELDDRIPLDVAKELERRYPNAIPIGAGAYGLAYDIGDNKVLKITYDEKEAENALKIMKKPSIAYVKVYSVEAVRDLHYLITEKVEPLSVEEIAIYQEVREYCHRLTKIYLSEKEAIERYLEAQYKKDKERYIMGEQVWDLVDRLSEIGSGLSNSDAHAKNLGWDKDHRLVLLDLGPS